MEPEANESRPGAGVDRGKLAAAVVIVGVIVALAVDNRQEVEIGYIVGESEVRLVYLLLLTAILGAIADRLIRWRRRR